MGLGARRGATTEVMAIVMVGTRVTGEMEVGTAEMGAVGIEQRMVTCYPERSVTNTSPSYLM
jgi:hypothetical protein